MCDLTDLSRVPSDIHPAFKKACKRARSLMQGAKVRLGVYARRYVACMLVSSVGLRSSPRHALVRVAVWKYARADCTHIHIRIHIPDTHGQKC